jgi:hypothetical protein
MFGAPDWFRRIIADAEHRRARKWRCLGLRLLPPAERAGATGKPAAAGLPVAYIAEQVRS